MKKSNKTALFIVGLFALPVVTFFGVAQLITLIMTYDDSKMYVPDKESRVSASTIDAHYKYVISKRGTDFQYDNIGKTFNGLFVKWSGDVKEVHRDSTVVVIVEGKDVVVKYPKNHLPFELEFLNKRDRIIVVGNLSSVSENEYVINKGAIYKESLN